MKLSLVVMIPGSSQGKQIPVTRTPFMIGRDAKCHLRPSSAIVSNRHCVLEIRAGKAFISDLKSTNGTFVNEERVEKDREIQDGDRIQIGPLSFGVKLEKHTPVDQPTPLPPSKTPAPAAEDESIAAVLLGMPDEGAGATTADKALDSTGVPTGGTEVLKTQDIPALTEDLAATGTGKDSKKDKADKVKAAEQTTSAVAEQLLKKYLRRPRKSE
jgi:predicted component of type VI protein secretion system